MEVGGEMLHLETDGVGHHFVISSSLYGIRDRNSSLLLFCLLCIGSAVGFTHTDGEGIQCSYFSLNCVGL